jgi:sarcosine oxidase subunit beta
MTRGLGIARAAVGDRVGRARGRPRPDFVVVGAGFYGVGLAWELAGRGARVVVLEADRIAAGASGGVGERGVRSNGRDVRQLPLMAIAQKRWPRLARVLGDRRVFRRTGHLQLIEADADLPAAEAQVHRQAKHGVRTRLIGRDELRRLEPHLSEHVIAAMYAPDDGTSDHDVATRALARAARERGARIVRSGAIAGLEVASGRVTAVVSRTGMRVAVADQLVLAANGGTAELVASAFDLRLPVVNVLPQVVVTRALDPVPVRHVIGHVQRRLAVKALPDGRVMITGGWLGRVNQTTGRGEAVDDQIAGNVAEAVAVYPSLAGVRVVHAMADRFESVSIDLLPIIDRIPGVANAVVVTAPSGQGWGPAPAYVSLVAEWLTDGRRPELLEPFGLARFASP